MLQRLNWLVIAGGTPAQRAGVMTAFSRAHDDYLRINADIQLVEIVAGVLTELGKPTTAMDILLERRRYAPLIETLSELLNLADGDTFIKQFVMGYFDRMQQTRDKVVVSGVTSDDQAFQMRKLGFFVVEIVERDNMWRLSNSVVDARLLYDPRVGSKAIVDALVEAQSKQTFVRGPADLPPVILLDTAVC